MKRWQWSFLLAAVALFGMACAPAVQGPGQAEVPADDQPRGGGVLTKWIGGDPPTLDNHQSNTYFTSDTAMQSYNGLVRYSPTDPVLSKIEPDLAERWDLSTDGKTYTFYLRTGVKFHDGSALTAQDALASLEKIKDPPKGMTSPRKNMFDPVDRMAAVDDFTLCITLKRPNPSFVPQLAQGWHSIYNKKWLEAGHDPGKEVMGTGPFLFKDYMRGVSYEAVKNPNYWRQGLPYLDGVKTFIIPDRGTTVAALRTGQLMEFGGSGPTPEDAKTLLQELGDKIVKQDTFGWGGRPLVNLSALRKPFDDVRVRQALSLAINRVDAIKVISAGESYIQGYMPAKGPWALPPDELVKMPGYGPDPEKNRAEAKRLLAEAGYPNGFDSKLGVRKLAGAEDAAIFLKDQWAKIGVNVSLDIQETATGYTNLEQGSFDLYSWGTAYALDDPDAVYAEHYLCNAPRNYSHVCVPQVDALYEKQTATIDPAERRKLVWEMEKIALQNVIKITVEGTQDRGLRWAFVRGFVAQPNRYNNLHMEGVWLAQR
ncbi:MAG: ABC transporter substrate-binding protein [Chloroflexi bacterium]|nr:ABC transporter substrate-binding protein [Chloroflexota bacterium]